MKLVYQDHQDNPDQLDHVVKQDLQVKTVLQVLLETEENREQQDHVDNQVLLEDLVHKGTVVNQVPMVYLDNGKLFIHNFIFKLQISVHSIYWGMCAITVDYL